MRPRKTTPAQSTEKLADLVCSNSHGSFQFDRAPGLLKAELRGLGSLILECAQEAAVPAGSSLAVDRDLFAALVTERIEGHQEIELIREEVTAVPEQTTIIASGPLTSSAMTSELQRLSGQDRQLSMLRPLTWISRFAGHATTEENCWMEITSTAP